MKKISLVALTLTVVVTGISIVGLTYKKNQEESKVSTPIIDDETLIEKPVKKSTDAPIDTSKEEVVAENSVEKIVEKTSQKPVEKPIDKLVGTKNTYINKLKSCEDEEKRIQAVAEIEDGYSNLGMQMTASKILTVWDDELNIMYQDLKSKMSPSEFNKLQSEQVQWIKDRDAIAIAAGKEFEGGSMQGLTILYSKSSTTRDRCYEIVNDYMK